MTYIQGEDINFDFEVTPDDTIAATIAIITLYPPSCTAPIVIAMTETAPLSAKFFATWNSAGSEVGRWIAIAEGVNGTFITKSNESIFNVKGAPC